MIKACPQLGFTAALLASWIAGSVARAGEQTLSPTPAPPNQVAKGSPSGEPQEVPGQLSSRFKINDDDPESSIPTDKEKNDNPMEFGYLLQDLLVKAEDARKQKQYSRLVHYDRAIAKGVPEQAQGWSKLCEAYRLINDREKATRACKLAIARPGATLTDFVQYVNLTIQKPQPLTKEEETDLQAVLAHLDQDPQWGVAAGQLRCQVGVKMHDLGMLQTCTSALAKLAPDDPKTVVFQWHLAVRKGQRVEAAGFLERAKMLGVPEDNIEEMLRFTPGASRGRPIVWAAGGMILLGVALSAIWLTRRRRVFA